MSSAAPIRIRFDHRESGFGLGTAAPRLSWQVPSADAGWRQAAYEIEQSPSTGSGGREARTGSGADQVLVDWPFAPLASRDRGSLRVRVAGDDGVWSDWSEPEPYEVSLLETSDWTARFITPTGHGALTDPAPVVATTFTVPGEPVSARLYSTALGLMITELNGTRAGDEELAPGWTAYDERLRVQTLDVTDLVTAGDNSLAVLLGNGWFRGNLGFVGQNCLYGDKVAALVQLEVELADGRLVIVSDDTWTSHGSEVIENDLYNGTRIDRSLTEYAQGGVELLDRDLATLVHPQGPPVRQTEIVPAVKVWTSPAGQQLVDFGQNVVGWVNITVRGLTAGTTVTVRHAEVLEHDELGTRPLRTARATDDFVVAGDAEEVLHPVFTFHGFRYAEITGAEVTAADVEAVVVGTDLERTGWFESSDAEVNQLHENVVWGMRGNFVDVPTDCPQRDERLGWTGDIEVFSPTASFLFDSAGFLSNWLRDLEADQYEDGSVPYVIPDILKTPTAAACAWGDAATVVPSVLHERFGDRAVLAVQFDSMRAWTDKIAALAGDDHLWTGGFQFGDWLDPDAPPDDAAAAKADPDVLATAYLARSADLTAAAAQLLGRDDDHARYAALAAATREAYNRAYVTDGGRIVSDATTAYAQALAWDLLSTDERRKGAGDRLADLVRQGGFRVSTGFIGTPLITDALTVAGHVDLAYRLLLERGNPSWLYPVTMGATTIWERWDSMLPDGTINPGQMTSFNHYALGAVADWMHRVVAGLAPAGPGYRSIKVAPLLGAGIDHATAKHVTPYGVAEVSWRRAGGEVELSVTVPVGSTAEVHLPDGSDVVSVGHGSHRWTVKDPVLDPGHPATVRELVDHPTLMNAMADLLTEHGIDVDAAALNKRLGPYLDREADEAIASMRVFQPRMTDELHAKVTELVRG